MGAIGHLNSFSGEKKQSFEIGNALLRYGEKYSNIRSQVVGHICIGHSYFADGDLEKAFSSYRKAVDVAEDPFYTQWPRAFVGLCCIMNDQINKAEEALNEVSSYLQNYGCEIFSPAVMPFVGIVLINKGEMSKGLKTIEEIQEYCREKNWGWGIALSEYVLGNLYYQIAYGEKPAMSIVLKNLGFLAKNVPFASKKAENYFNKAIESAKEFGAKGILGQVYLDLGLLHKAKKRKNSAGKCISEAINIFEQIGAEVRLKQAKDALSSL
jgi:tetratricopeptide (TPR) repeat protein